MSKNQLINEKYMKYQRLYSQDPENAIYRNKLEKYRILKQTGGNNDADDTVRKINELIEYSQSMQSKMKGGSKSKSRVTGYRKMVGGDGEEQAQAQAQPVVSQEQVPQELLEKPVEKLTEQEKIAVANHWEAVLQRAEKEKVKLLEARDRLAEELRKGENQLKEVANTKLDEVVKRGKVLEEQAKREIEVLKKEIDDKSSKLAGLNSKLKDLQGQAVSKGRELLEASRAMGADALDRARAEYEKTLDKIKQSGLLTQSDKPQ